MQRFLITTVLAVLVLWLAPQRAAAEASDAIAVARAVEAAIVQPAGPILIAQTIRAEKPRCPACPKRQKAGMCSLDCPASAGLVVAQPDPLLPDDEPRRSARETAGTYVSGKPELPPPRG